MTKIYNYLTMAIIGGYIIYLYVIKRLNFLIHERYLIFTLIAGLVLLIVGLLGSFYLSKSNKSKFKFNMSFIILVISILIPFIPLRSLSSESFDIRSVNKNVRISENEKQDIKQKINFKINTNEFSMYDWVKAKGLDDLSIFKDKEFTGTGFISPKEGTFFSLSRFILSCCVVDATPVGILVDYDYNKEYKPNDWLEVKGKFKIQEVNGIKEPIIVPTSIIKINQPDNVYLNRN
jgi:putative membrane protein